MLFPNSQLVTVAREIVADFWQLRTCELRTFVYSHFRFPNPRKRLLYRYNLTFTLSKVALPLRKLTIRHYSRPVMPRSSRYYTRSLATDTTMEASQEEIIAAGARSLRSELGTLSTLDDIVKAESAYSIIRRDDLAVDHRKVLRKYKKAYCKDDVERIGHDI